MTVSEYNQTVDKYSDNLYRFVLKNIKDEDKAKDIVQDLRRGNYEAAKVDYKRFVAGTNALSALRRYDEIHNVHVQLVAAIEATVGILKGKVQRGLHDLPNGTYIFKSEHIDIVIKVKEGTVLMNRKVDALGLTKEEWELAKKGKPAAIVEAVENDLRKNAKPLAGWLGL